MRKTFLRLAGAAVAVATVLCTAQISSAQRVGPDTIALFPKNIGEFAYANLKQARSQKWFPQLQEQMLPERFRQFEKFLASAGVDPNSQVEEVAWGLIAEGVTSKTEGTGSTAVPTGEEIVGVALGSYNPDSTEAYFKTQKLPTFKSHGFTMYAFGSGAGPYDLFFLFIDANTLAQLLQLALVYQQYQAKQQNQDLSQLLGQAQVTPGGDRVTLRMSLSDDQMAALIKKNTFALKM